MEQEGYDPWIHKDRPMNEAERRHFILELSQKRIETALVDLGRQSEPILTQAHSLLKEWVPLAERYDGTADEGERADIRAEIDILSEKYDDVIPQAARIIERLETKKFSEELAEVKHDLGANLPRVLEDHMMRYAYLSHDLPSSLSAKLWLTFGRDERIRPYIRRAFEQDYQGLIENGLSPRNIVEVIRWLENRS